MSKKIKEFYIGEANYYINDGNGGRIHLILNYAENTYEIRPDSSNSFINKILEKQAKMIAMDLLERKAKLNLVNNLKQKGII